MQTLTIALAKHFVRLRPPPAGSRRPPPPPQFGSLFAVEASRMIPLPLAQGHPTAQDSSSAVKRMTLRVVGGSEAPRRRKIPKKIAEAFHYAGQGAGDIYGTAQTPSDASVERRPAAMHVLRLPSEGRRGGGSSPTTSATSVWNRRLRLQKNAQMGLAVGSIIAGAGAPHPTSRLSSCAGPSGGKNAPNPVDVHVAMRH